LIKYFQILFILLIPSFAFTQTPDDSVKVLDSLKSAIDTSKQVQSDIDAVIEYSARDSAIFNLKEKTIHLYYNGELIYKDLKLKAGHIIINQETQILDAVGIDTSGEGKITQVPLMYQGEEKYEGAKLTYNFKTQQGMVSMGFSDAEVGYYFGEKIKKVTPQVYFIQNGLYTTSTDKEDPEYYFFSPKMKIIPKDKVIAESVYLYIEGVPVFWIPFAVFPNRSGRSSGIIPPTYGTDATYGVYFSKFGYFWAINDYMDIASTASWFSKGRIDLNARYRYSLKYVFDGQFDGGYSRIRLGESKDVVGKTSSDAWALNLVHSHKINPTTSLNGNLSFVSSKSYYDNSSNVLSDILRQNAVSNLTLSKFWEGTPYSMSLNYYRDQNLQNGDVFEKIPSVNFSNSEIYPFRENLSSTDNLKFYDYFSYSYNGFFENERIKRTIKNNLGLDSTYRDSRLGVKHNISLNFSPTYKFFNIKPFFNYTEIWYAKYVTKTFNPQDSSVLTTDHNGFKAVRYFQTGVSLNTKLIGIIKPNIFGIKGIRHTITPSINYIYSPDFSSDGFGYYGKYTDATGRQIKYSFFEKEIFGSAPIGENQSLFFNVGNLFEMKTRVNDTTDNKFQLININLGIFYNFAADSLKFSDLRADFRTQIGNILNIGGGATFNFYKFEPSVNSRINKYLWNTDGKIADLTSVNFNLSTSYSFNLSNGVKNPKQDSLKTNKKDLEKNIPEKVILDIPLTGSINYNYSESRANPANIFRSSNVSGNLAFSLTQKWKFTVTSGYDLVNKQVSAPYITAYRDLNSWEINFNWYPTGTFRGFRLEIKIKAPELQDIKITKQTSNRGVYGTF
jgi:lipopolysaccharide assembly outer membrane protein LptD (OstA)